ncbi:MAG: Gfo/Idh/MocA family oxidoreductase [Bacteroidales bacterium]
MENNKAVIGFIGAGGIARSHAFSLNSLKFYYPDAPEVDLAAVTSARKESRESFAARYGFQRACPPEELLTDKRISAVFILGPNNVHYEHFKAAASMDHVKKIYLEKPVCSNSEEEAGIRSIMASRPGLQVQVGFQYLYTSAVREALTFWKSGALGKPVHFEFKYYHSDYLKKSYREKRVTRLTPAPDGGAMADLGSHILSLLIAFMGEKVEITSAVQAGEFEDVPADSDLFSQISLFDRESRAAGTLSASRISSGTGDSLSFELYATGGAVRFSSAYPGQFEYYTEESGTWSRKVTGSNYKPFTSFPSGHVPGGWHRAMMHAHYVFLTDSRTETFVPDIMHGLAVQKLLTSTAEHLASFRKRK